MPHSSCLIKLAEDDIVDEKKFSYQSHHNNFSAAAVRRHKMSPEELKAKRPTLIIELQQIKHDLLLAKKDIALDTSSKIWKASRILSRRSWLVIGQLKHNFKKSSLEIVLLVYEGIDAVPSGYHYPALYSIGSPEESQSHGLEGEGHKLA